MIEPSASSMLGVALNLLGPVCTTRTQQEAWKAALRVGGEVPYQQDNLKGILRSSKRKSRNIPYIIFRIPIC